MSIHEIATQLKECDPESAKEDLAFAFTLMSQWQRETVVAEERNIVELFKSLLNLILPDKRINHDSIHPEVIQDLSKLIMKFLTKFLQDLIFWKVSVSNDFQVTILFYFLTFKSVLFEETSSSVENFYSTFFKFVNCDSTEDIFAKFKVKQVLEKIKMRTCNKEEEWTSIFGNAAIFEFIIFNLK